MSANKAKYMFNLRLKRAKRNLSSQPSPNRTSFLLNKKKKESTLFSWYSQQLDERPILTKCVTACMISSTGNILAQKIKHDQKEEEDNISRPFTIECEQVGRFAFLNMIFVAPVLHHWYQFINRAVPGKSMSRVLQRVFWDEFVFSPVYIPVFLGGLWTLEGTKPEKINTMLYNELPSIIVAEWILWVPTMTLTFKYAPVKFQVLVINCVVSTASRFAILCSVSTQGFYHIPMVD
jgi:hypothetical protein